jgi:hypothetical protein
MNNSTLEDSTLDDSIAEEFHATATASQSVREQEIRNALAAYEAQLEKWRHDPGSSPPGLEFWHSCADIVHAFAAGPIPTMFLAAVEAVEQLATFLLRLIQVPGISLSEHMPDSGLFTRTEAIEAVLKETEKPLPALESIETLLKQEVGPEQIARMHGISIDQVLKEKETPGSLGPNYVPPALAAMKRDRQDRAKSYSSGVVLACTAPKLACLGLGTGANHYGVNH